MNAENADALNLRFTRTELAELVTRIGGQPFLGLQPESKTDMNEPVAGAVHKTVQQSLLARGALIRQANGKIVLDNTIEKLLKLCVHPEYRVVILGRRGPTATPQYEIFYLTKNLTIRQFESLPGIFDLTVFKERPDFSDSIAAYFVNKTTTDSEAISLSYTTFHVIESMIANGSIADALETLTEAGVQTKTAEILCNVLAQYTMKLYLELANAHDQSTNAITFVYDELGCVEIGGLESQESEDVVLQLITRETHQRRVDRFFGAIAT